MKTNYDKLSDMQLLGMYDALKLLLCYDNNDYKPMYSFFRLVNKQADTLENELIKRGIEL